MKIGDAVPALEHDLFVFDDKDRYAGRAVRFQSFKNMIDLFLTDRCFSHTNREGEQADCSEYKRNLCGYFASFAVKSFYRKGRKGKPQSSQRKISPPSARFT